MKSRKQTLIRKRKTPLNINHNYIIQDIFDIILFLTGDKNLISELGSKHLHDKWEKYSSRT